MFGTIRLIQRLKVHRPSKHAQSWPNKADGLNLKLEEQMVSSLCLFFVFFPPVLPRFPTRRQAYQWLRSQCRP